VRYNYYQGVTRERFNTWMLVAATVASAVVLAFSAIAQQASALTSTQVVTGNTSAGENQPGWLFNRDLSTSTPYEFNTDEASIGAGALYVKPIGATPANKFIAENFINKPVADVNSISYDFKIGAGGTAADANQFYMNVYANFGQSNDLKFYDCRYNVVPTVGSTGSWTTVTFDPTVAYPVTTHGTSPHTCPAVPADMDTLSPGSNIRVFAINVGDTSTSDVGLDGYLDKVVTDAAGDITTYDFEPALSPATKDECKNGNWATFNTPAFGNQGQCVAWVASSQNSKHHQ
jgi:hypothetical protein